MSESEKAAVGKPVNQFPIDLANKATLVKADVKVGTVQGHQTFRTIPSQPHMRVVTMPAGVTSPQIIQTMLPQGILKQTRPINQSITVTKAQGGYIARGPATITSLQTNKAAISSPIRTPTPPASGPVTSLSQVSTRFWRLLYFMSPTKDRRHFS